MEKEKQKYIIQNGEKLEASDKEYYEYYKLIWALRKKEQLRHRCVCPKNALWKCEGDINKNVVTIKLSDSELREFHFLLGFSYALAFTDLGDFVKTDYYVQILKERLTDYEDEYKKKLEDRKPQTSEQLKIEELE